MKRVVVYHLSIYHILIIIFMRYDHKNRDNKSIEAKIKY